MRSTLAELPEWTHSNPVFITPTVAAIPLVSVISWVSGGFCLLFNRVRHKASRFRAVRPAPLSFNCCFVNVS